MALLQGNTYLKPVQVLDSNGNVIKANRVVKGEFVFGDLYKYFGDGGEVVWNDRENAFIVPLTEEDTFSLDGVVECQVRIVLDDGSVSGSVPEGHYVYTSKSKTRLTQGGAGEESGELLTIKLLKEIGGGGTSDYNYLDNKPSINGVVLEGDKSTEDLGIVSQESDPTVPQFVKNISEQDIESWNNKATESYVDAKVADLVNSAPETLDTLGEVAKAIQENESVVDALNSAIGNKADRAELKNYVASEELEDLVKEVGEGYFAKEKDLKDINVNEFAKEFVVGYSSTEISSVNAWTQATAPIGFNQRQRSCIYGNGYYVIAGTGGQMAYSKDAITWTMIDAFTADVVTGLAYGNGYFLAVDSGGKIFRCDMPFGAWENVYTFTGIVESIRYINNTFVVVGANGLITMSADGAVWNNKESGVNVNLIDSGYGNGKYVVVGASGTILTSINGEIWYNKTTENITTDIRAVMYANGQFVLGSSGGRIDFSVDGENWVQANNPSSLTIAWIRNFTYYANRLYAVMYASNGQGEIWISNDKGKTWAVAQTVAGRLWCVTSGNDKFIASGDGGAIYTLDLGIEWNNKGTDAEYEWYRFKISQNDGSVIYSDVYYNNSQKNSDGTLETENKTIVGAINEINNKISGVNAELENVLGV